MIIPKINTLISLFIYREKATEGLKDLEAMTRDPVFFTQQIEFNDHSQAAPKSISVCRCEIVLPNLKGCES